MERYSPKKNYYWSNEIAYLVGLIASDGCLSKDRRHINLTSKDAEIIVAARTILNKPGYTRIKLGAFNTVAYDLQFSDVALYDFLHEHGVTSAKSKTIKAVNVPDRFYPDFLRGYFDGDGTTYGYRDSRWGNSFMYYVGFASASYQFMEWLQVTNMRLFSVTAGSITLKSRVYVLTYAKKDSRRLFAGMYWGGEIHRLSRKYHKLKGFIQSN